MKFLAFQFVPIASLSITGGHWAAAVCVFFTFSHYWHTQMRLPRACSPDKTVPAVSLLGQTFPCPFTGLTPVFHVCLVLGSPDWTQHSWHVSLVLRRQVIVLDLLATVLLLRPRMLLATFAPRECCWLMFSLYPPGPPLILLFFHLPSIISPANIPEIKAQSLDMNLWIYVISWQVWLTLFVTAEGERLYLLHSSREVSELKVWCWHQKRCWKIRKA